MTSDNAIQSAKYLFFANIVIMIINASVSILIIKYFSVTEYGHYAYIFSFTIIFSLFSNLGFPGLLQKYLPKINIIESNLLINQLFYIQSSILIALLIIFYFINVNFLFIEEHSAAVIIYIYFFVINSLIFRSYLSIKLEFRFLYILLIILTFLKLILMYSLYIYNLFSIKNLLYILIGFEVILFSISFLKKINIVKYNRYLDKNSLYINSIPFVKEKLFDMFMTASVSIWFLKSFHAVEEIAYYVFVVSISLLIANNISLLVRWEIIFTNFFIKTVEEVDERLLLTLWYKGFLLIAIPVIIFLFIFSTDISIFIFNDKYSDQMLYLNILILLLFISHISYLYTPIIYKKDDLNVFAKYSFVASFVHISLIIIFGMMYGYVGCIFALGCAFSSKGIYLIYRYGLPIDLISTYKFSLKLSAISLCAGLIVSSIVTSSTLLFLSLLMYLLIGLSMIYKIKMFSSKEKKLIEHKFINRKFGFIKEFI